MDQGIRKQARKTLGRLGVAVRGKVGRPSGGLAPDEEVWILEAGSRRTQVVATPFRNGRIPRDPGSSPPRLLVAGHFPTAVAERIVDAGHGLVDGAGNVHLRLPGIVLHVLGNEPAARSRAEQVFETPVRREWRRPALRVLFQLLCNPELAERSTRTIAAAAGVAPGTVHHLLGDLERMGHLVRIGGRRRRFLPDPGLVDTWASEYGRKLRPGLLAGRFAPVRPDWWKDFEPTEHAALWGGEMAAMLLGADLRPGLWTLHAAPTRGLLRAAGLRTDREGAVEIRRPFWVPSGSAPAAMPGAPREDTAPPLLVVGDLLAVDDGRCRAAARHVREKHLARLLG